MHVAVAGGELLAEEEELGDLVEVGFLIEDGASVLEGFELVPVGRCFGVEFASAPGEAVRPVAVGNVVRSATEGVNGAHGQALFLGEVLERVIEIAGFPPRQFFAVAVSEFVELGRWLLRPNRSVEMRERVNQFVRFADDANERCTLSKGFHGGYAHSFHGVPGEGDTRTQSVKRGRRAHIVVAGAARCVRKRFIVVIIDLTEIVAPEMADISCIYFKLSSLPLFLNCLSHLLDPISPPQFSL